MFSRLMIGTGLVLGAYCAFAQDAQVIEDSPEAACTVLKNHMAKIEGLPDEKPFPRWFCDVSTIQNEYLYIIALRSAASEQDLASGNSNAQVAGWFAVARRSTLVVEWDVAEDRLIPISDAYYASRKGQTE